MLIHFYLSTDTLLGLLRFRILDAYRPVMDPKITGTVGFMDGLENVTLSHDNPSPAPRSTFVLNVPLPGNKLGPAAGFTITSIPALALRVQADIFFVLPAALPTKPDAGGVFPRPDRYPLHLDGGFALFMTLDPSSDPALAVMVYNDPLAPFGNTAALFNNKLVPLPIGATLSDLTGPGGGVLNVGIAPIVGNAGCVVRIEVDDPNLPPPSERMASWDNFFAGNQKSELGGRGWAATLPSQALLRRVEGLVDEQAESAKVQTVFDNHEPSSGTWSPSPPSFTLSKSGTLPHACLAFNVKVVVHATVFLSVPTGNTIRLTVHLDLVPDEWDLVLCGLAAILVPLSEIYTGFDNTAFPWWGAFGLGILERLFGPLLVYVLALMDSWLTNFALKQIQNQAESQAINIIRTGDGDAYADFSIPLIALGGASWLTIQEIAGDGDDLVIRGDFRAPHFDIPLHLVGVETEGFDGWSKPKCSPPSLSDYKTAATLQLLLEDPLGNQVRVPAIPYKCGIDQTGKDVCWDVVNDPYHVYDYWRPGTGFYWTGIPGAMEVSTMNVPESFSTAPYGLSLQMFTSYGCRQFDFPAPPPVPKLPSTPQEQEAEAVRRISECNAISSLLAGIKALQFHWLGRPPEDGTVLQHWQIRIQDLSATDVVRAWDAERGTLLAEVRSWGHNVAELSLVAEDEVVQVLQLTLNRETPLSMNRYAELSADLVNQGGRQGNLVHAQQGTVTRIAEISLPGTADGVSVRANKQRISIAAWNKVDRWLIESHPHDKQNWVITRDREHGAGNESFPIAGLRLEREVGSDGSSQLLAIVAGEERGRFVVARPWYYRGSASGSFYVRLSELGDRIILFSRHRTRSLYPQIGRQDD